ncbi:alpha/beta fold hydrolase [Amycolatopsis anabasis]|uniref:alpha/beta fold hydrolase n=1 Tax=Amycolatopsis anabasis TaxID=1840409 RepID=UPI001C556668|nr:alpha/beta hydrolase [Amycolatopsis anabasis]
MAVRVDPRVNLFVARTDGPADKAVLVIHGGPDWDHSYLREPLGRLAGQHDLILPDLRGCGRSTRGLADNQYTPDAVIDDLTVLLDVLGVAGADVLGFSYGGLLAQRLALAAPHRVRRLIIASSSVLPVPDNAFQGWKERDRSQAAERAVWADTALSGPELTRQAATAAAPANVWREAALPDYLARLRRVRFSAEWMRPWRAGTLPSAWCDNAASRLADSGIPILLLHGRHDMTFPATLVEQTATLIPATRTVILDDAGHMAHIDQPEPWLTTVSEFLT